MLPAVFAVALVSPAADAVDERRRRRDLRSSCSSSSISFAETTSRPTVISGPTAFARSFSAARCSRMPWCRTGMTRTCTGHSSIATGTLPSSHGIVDNEWFDRGTSRFVSCTEDPGVSPVAIGPGRATERHSARHLRAPTLADELRRQAASPPRIVSLALKARSAISLVGHGGARTLAMWEEDSGTWATSTAYATVPAPEVASFLAAHPASRRARMPRGNADFRSRRTSMRIARPENPQRRVSSQPAGHRSAHRSRQSGTRRRSATRTSVILPCR